MTRLCYTCDAPLTGTSTRHVPGCPRPQWQEPIPLPEAVEETSEVTIGELPEQWVGYAKLTCEYPVINGILTLA